MVQKLDKVITFEDHNQNFWQLASIQGAALGLPGMLVGAQLAKEFGAGIAICSIIIGNLILWLIGLAIISMTGQARTNAIENVKRYLGRGGGIIAALVLVIAFLGWFTLQIKMAVTIVGNILDPYLPAFQELNLRLGVALGLIISLLSIGGIRLIKWICVISLPILIFVSLYLIFSVKISNPSEFNLELSFTAITSVVIIVLPGIVNLPTFFRHSRSKAHSFLGLSLMTLFVCLFQCFTIWIGITDSGDFSDSYFLNYRYNVIIVVMLTLVLLALICINLVNIYFASAGWEAIVRRGAGPKEYAIVGLAGTAVFTFLQISSPMEFLENMVNSFIASLGVILLVAFLMRIIVRHRPRTLEKFLSNTCWFLGCFAALFVLIQHPDDPNRSVLVGVSVSALAFLVILFIEETVWSIKQLTLRKETK